VTDADLVLGILNPDRPLPGGLKLDHGAALEGVRALGVGLGLDPPECAAGIVEVVDSHMEDLVRRVTVQRGQDPRDLSLWAYGGASGAHAALFSRQLNVKRVVFPLGDTASVWSALGCVLLAPRREFHSSVLLLAPWDLSVIVEWLDRLERQAQEYAQRAGVEEGTFRFVRSANLKYGLQVNEVEVALPEGPIDDEWAGTVSAEFERRYERHFGEGTGYSGAGVTMTALRVVLESTEGPPPAHPTAFVGHDAEAIPDGVRPVYWRELGGWFETPIVSGARLEPRKPVAGPVVVEYPHTTVVGRPGQTLWLEPNGNVVLDVHGGGAPAQMGARPS